MPASVSISFSVEQESLQNELSSVQGQKIPDWRQACMRQLAKRILKQIIFRNPVDTARSRAAWVQALEDLGSNAPVGWQGDTVEQAAVAEGREQGSAAVSETDETTEITATNGVDYVPLLEYGTSQSAAFQMVQQSLREEVGAGHF